MNDVATLTAPLAPSPDPEVSGGLAVVSIAKAYDKRVVLSDVCEGEGEESKTMPLEVASAGWFALVGDALPHSFLRCFCAFPLKVTRAFSAAQLRSASLNRPRRVWASSFRS